MSENTKISKNIAKAAASMPAGTCGLAIEPWSGGEVYAVAANWAQASSPVYTYGDRGWHPQSHGMQVADFRHEARAALRMALAEALRASGDDEDDADDLVDDAVDIESEAR